MFGNYKKMSSTAIEPEREANCVFIESLDELTPDDVLPIDQRKKKNKKISSFDIVRLLIFIVSICIFGYCVLELSGIIADYQTGDDIYDELAEGFNNAFFGSDGEDGVSRMLLSGSDKPMSSYADILANGIVIYDPVIGDVDRVSMSARFRNLLIYLEGLRDENAETYGYIYIPNSKISYPLVQAKDNDYYLTHSFMNTKLSSGAVFIDFRNDKKIERNQNIVIYGHNMTNGSMFCDVSKYLEKEFFMNNDIEIVTFDGIYTFEVFSAYTTTKYDQYFSTHFANDAAFVNFCKERESLSRFHKEGITFNGDDVTITLSTCILGDEEGRYAVHAKLVKVET